MANRMIVVPEEVYDNLVSKSTLQDGVDKRLHDASAAMTSALHSITEPNDAKYLKYDQRLKEVQRLLHQRNEKASMGQGQIVGLLKNIADGIQKVSPPQALAPAIPVAAPVVDNSLVIPPPPKRNPPPIPKRLPPTQPMPPPIPPRPTASLPAAPSLPAITAAPQYAAVTQRLAMTAPEIDDANDMDWDDYVDGYYGDAYPTNKPDPFTESMNAPLPDDADDPEGDMDSSDTLQVAVRHPDVIKVDTNQVKAQRIMDLLRERIMANPSQYGVTANGKIAKPRVEGDRWRGPRVFRGSLDGALEYILGMGRGRGPAPPGVQELMLNLRNDPLIRDVVGRMSSHRPNVKDMLRRYETSYKVPKGHHTTPFKPPKFHASLYNVKDPGDEWKDYEDPDPETPRTTAREMVNRTLEDMKKKKGIRGQAGDSVRSYAKPRRLNPEAWKPPRTL